MPLLEKDDDDLTALHYYDSAIQLARVSSRPPTETEYEMGMEAAGQIQEMCVFEHLNVARDLIMIVQS